MIFFHLSNAYLFPIGVFPWFMLAATTLYLDSSWPRRVLAALKLDRPLEASPTSAIATPEVATQLRLPPRWLALLLVAHFALQLVVPFRHHLYPGDASWTEEGHLFAWRMKLRDKRGTLYFRVSDPVTGEVWTCLPHRYLARHQATFMTYSPDVIWQHAQHVAEEFRCLGHPHVEVRAESSVSFNQRPPQPLVDPTVDLARVKRPFGPAPWIMPLRSANEQLAGPDLPPTLSGAGQPGRAKSESLPE